jgi:hypothetical protein
MTLCTLPRQRSQAQPSVHPLRTAVSLAFPAIFARKLLSGFLVSAYPGSVSWCLLFSNLPQRKLISERFLRHLIYCSIAECKAKIFAKGLDAAAEICTSAPAPQCSLLLSHKTPILPLNETNKLAAAVSHSPPL